MAANAVKPGIEILESEAVKASRIILDVNMASASATSAVNVTENDIPGASLCGRKPAELKNEEGSG